MGIGISNNVGCVNNVSSSFLGGLVTIPTYQEVASAGVEQFVVFLYSTQED
jgi:hypothetical protein